MNSGLFFGYQPMQSMTNTNVPEIRERLTIQLFFMRANTEIIGLPRNGVGVGGRVMAVKKKEAGVPMNEL